MSSIRLVAGSDLRATRNVPCLLAQRLCAGTLEVLAAVALALPGGCTPAPSVYADSASPPYGRLESIRRADPSAIRYGASYHTVEADGESIYARTASSLDALNGSPPTRIWGSKTHVWAPEIVQIDGRFYVYFAAGNLTDQRMYVISSREPTRDYCDAMPLRLPDDKWAIDGVPYRFNDQWWFVWSGWPGDQNVEQDLYIARMTDATTVAGPRYRISQPTEPWERQVGNPYVNEGPQPIKDPSGQLHIVYSANGSWSSDYCLVDLRLRANADPTDARNWDKSNGCLFGANASLMMDGTHAAKNAQGTGHHTFALEDGDIDASPPSAGRSEFLYHGVPRDIPMRWSNRYWYTGGFEWWDNVAYCRAARDCSTGWSLRFYE